MLRTEVACQSPPRGELMPRALSASAICRSEGTHRLSHLHDLAVAERPTDNAPA